MTTLTIDGIAVELSNLNKVLFPDAGITKGEIIDYYIRISNTLLPHLADRPVVLTRYPDGIKGNSFYQKNMPEFTPPWVTTYPIYSKHSDRVIHYCIVDKLPTLVWLINLAALEIHPYLSRTVRLECPDYAVIDLDPMERSTWEDVLTTALVTHEVLNHLGLQSYPKTSGATGLQIYIPLENKYSYAEVRGFAHYICSIVNQLLPNITSLERRIKDRQGRLYLDYLQNVLGKTLAGAYCVRPRLNAPVSTPVTWEEIRQHSFTPLDFTIRTVLPRLEQRGDLFADVLYNKQNIDRLLSKTTN